MSSTRAQLCASPPGPEDSTKPEENEPSFAPIMPFSVPFGKVYFYISWEGACLHLVMASSFLSTKRQTLFIYLAKLPKMLESQANQPELHPAIPVVGLSC